MNDTTSAVVTPRGRSYGCRRDIRDPRDQKFKVTRGRVPASVDHSAYCPAIMDQGDTGSCVAHSWTGVLRWHVRRHGGPDKALSRLQLYYDGRVVENSVDDDAGLEIRTGAKVIKKIGVGPEDLWPYVESRFKEKPPADIYKFANMWGGLTYERVDVSAFALKRALAENGPVVIGVTLFSSFESEQVDRSGVVPMPNVDKEDLVGGHAMYVVGYNTGGKCPPEHAKVANSWSAEWGDNGFCYIPMKMLGSTEFGGDYWTVRNLGGA